MEGPSFDADCDCVEVLVVDCEVLGVAVLKFDFVDDFENDADFDELGLSLEGDPEPVKEVGPFEKDAVADLSSDRDDEMVRLGVRVSDGDRRFKVAE